MEKVLGVFITKLKNWDFNFVYNNLAAGKIEII